jgi:AraC family transcriptional regulator, transcriptional activator of pobA
MGETPRLATGGHVSSLLAPRPAGRVTTRHAVRMAEASRTSIRATLAIDRFAGPGTAVEVRRLANESVGPHAIREPHRHDYHELIWVRSGSGEHRVDGEPVAVQAGAINIVGRGQVHVFTRAEKLTGALIRFRDEVLFGCDVREGAPSWLLTGNGGRTVAVPADGFDRVDALVDALVSESLRPPDSRSSALVRHLVSALLLWMERWYDDTRTERRNVDDAEVELYRRFSQLLERDFSRHHDAAHYAAALAVPAPALSRALNQATGRATKDLVIDRVMIEAARLLRFTGDTVQQIAHATGFADPFHFSRLFKRRHGLSPVAYRNETRGRSA